jgi:hypothetical protein
MNGLVKGEAKVVFAEPVVESDGEAYYAGRVEKLHVLQIRLAVNYYNVGRCLPQRAT